MNQIKKQKLSEVTKQWLIANGYNPNNFNQQGENGDTALMKATREGVYAVVRELIDLGAKINIDNQNDNGATVLMYAASAGKTGVAKLLLQYKPNLELRNLDDYKAIDFASNIEILGLLKNAAK
jgi:uncharacterized protein